MNTWCIAQPPSWLLPDNVKLWQLVWFTGAAIWLWRRTRSLIYRTCCEPPLSLASPSPGVLRPPSPPPPSSSSCACCGIPLFLLPSPLNPPSILFSSMSRGGFLFSPFHAFHSVLLILLSSPVPLFLHPLSLCFPSLYLDLCLHIHLASREEFCFIRGALLRLSPTVDNESCLYTKFKHKQMTITL